VGDVREVLDFGLVLVEHLDAAGAVDDNLLSGRGFNELDPLELDGALDVGLVPALDNAHGDTAGVEGAERELRAGFADGLRGDDADRFAEFHHTARRQVAAIALAADAAACLAGKNGANVEFLDAGVLNVAGHLLGDL